MEVLGQLEEDIREDDGGCEKKIRSLISSVVFGLFNRGFQSCFYFF